VINQWLTSEQSNRGGLMICDTHTTVIYLKDVSSVLGFRANRREETRTTTAVV